MATYKDAQIRATVKRVPHPNPKHPARMLAELLLNQYLNAEAEKVRSTEELHASSSELHSIHEKVRALGLSPENLQSEIDTMRSCLEESWD